VRVLVTGSKGFIAKNLIVRLLESGDSEVSEYSRESGAAQLQAAVRDTDFVVHLAGVNRPPDPAEFGTTNVGFTEELCAALRATGRPIPVIFSSSTQAGMDNPYGSSKRAAEEVIHAYGNQTGAPVYVYRLANVFGKWCRPNYNSVVATFCHNIARGLPIVVNDPSVKLSLAYVDDVVAEFIRILRDGPGNGSGEPLQIPVSYQSTVGELAAQITAFRDSRKSLVTERVGTGLTRALYATYISYCAPDHVMYEIPRHADARGVFVEMLKTPDAGQFSFFTAHPGVTRGGHYHHSKTEKFLVIAGEALFRFRHIITSERFEIRTTGDIPTVVETVPGWAHDITNTGKDEMIVMLWANENFDRERPDTIASRV